MRETITKVSQVQKLTEIVHFDHFYVILKSAKLLLVNPLQLQ